MRTTSIVIPFDLSTRATKNLSQEKHRVWIGAFAFRSSEPNAPEDLGTEFSEPRIFPVTRWKETSLKQDKFTHQSQHRKRAALEESPSRAREFSTSTEDRAILTVALVCGRRGVLLLSPCAYLCAR